MTILKKRYITLLSLSLLSLTACTNTISHSIDEQGHVQPDNIVFPNMDKAWQKSGIFPNRDNLNKIKAGVSKNDLYYLIGYPHFNEVKNAHEWDYIMKFYQPDNSIRTCQYKIIFDKNYRAQEFYWLPVDCSQYATTN